MSLRFIRMDDEENKMLTDDFLKVLEDKLFTPNFQHSIILIGGLVAGLSTAMTIEYHTYFELNRNVPVWETVLVASITSSLSLWFSMILINIARKFYPHKK